MLRKLKKYMKKDDSWLTTIIPSRATGLPFDVVLPIKTSTSKFDKRRIYAVTEKPFGFGNKGTYAFLFSENGCRTLQDMSNKEEATIAYTLDKFVVKNYKALNQYFNQEIDSLDLLVLIRDINSKEYNNGKIK